MSRIVCVSNRVSLPDPQTGKIKAGGLAVGVKAALESHGGCVWFGWDGSVTPDNDSSTLPRRTFSDGITFITMPLTRTQYDGYYKKMANEILWPFMHALADHIEEHGHAHEVYQQVNKLFARRLRPYLRPDDIIWVHDYHLIPLGRALRQLGVTNTILFFNHIPIPGCGFVHGPGIPRALRHQYRELVNDFFYYDQVGFQSFRDLANFTRYLNCHPRMPARFTTITLSNNYRQTRFGVFPISVETLNLERQAKTSRYCSVVRSIQDSIAPCRLVIGAERLDYTKGLSHRIAGISYLLSHFPEYREKIKYLQIAPLSRDDVGEYQNTIQKTRDAVRDVQSRFGNDKWKPIYYSEKNVPRDQLFGCFRLADIGLVTPLIDGQNLVAKEFIAAQDPENPGVLILSKYAGAAEELGELGTILVDPYDPEHIAAKLRRAMEMDLEDRKELHSVALQYLRVHDIHNWAEMFLANATALDKIYPLSLPRTGSSRSAWSMQ